jgi:hypothetical protein
MLLNNNLPESLALRCLIMDEDEPAADTLRSHLLLQSVVASVSKTDTLTAATFHLQQEEVDIFFVPVRLWNWRMLLNVHSMPVLVFTATQSENYTEDLAEEVPYDLRAPYLLASVIRMFQRLTSDIQYLQPVSNFGYDSSLHEAFAGGAIQAGSFGYGDTS